MVKGPDVLKTGVGGHLCPFLLVRVLKEEKEGLRLLDAVRKFAELQQQKLHSAKRSRIKRNKPIKRKMECLWI